MPPYLAAEGAGVFSMLADLNLLHHLPERRAITRAVFTDDPHLLGALGLGINKTEYYILTAVAH